MTRASRPPWRLLSLYLPISPYGQMTRARDHRVYISLYLPIFPMGDDAPRHRGAYISLYLPISPYGQMTRASRPRGPYLPISPYLPMGR